MSEHIKKGMEEKLLGLLYKRYVTKFGHGIRNIDECAFSIGGEAMFLKDMPELRVVEGLRTSSLYLPLMKELESKCLVRHDRQGLAFFLTEEGCRRGAMKLLDKALDFCNKNAGAAVFVAIVAALASIGSMVAAVMALNSTPATCAPSKIQIFSPYMEPSRTVVNELNTVRIGQD
ncbi:hypothetical protein [Pseudomonas sp. UM16]|uniref:hypothetical protein n=1 Tax=Pseudomonas sp. UM16 TaxID=3158962 RepID=UPI00398FA2B1